MERADGNAEIVNVSNNFFIHGDTGVTVFGDADDHWVPTRAIWNQHSYHVTNVLDDGRIPRFETPSWVVQNGYRINVASGGSDAAPDLTAGGLRKSEVDGGWLVSARIGNAGAVTTPPNIRIAFLHEPAGGSTEVLEVVRLRERLAPGRWADVEITIDTPIEADDVISVSADDDGTGSSANHECGEANNLHGERFGDLTADPVPSPPAPATAVPTKVIPREPFKVFVPKAWKEG